MTTVQDQEVIQALRANGLYRPLGERVSFEIEGVLIHRLPIAPPRPWKEASSPAQLAGGSGLSSNSSYRFGHLLMSRPSLS